MRIAVCRPQEPFKHGGAEIFADTLTAELRARGHEVELVTVPFQTWPNERLLTGGMTWRLLDLGPDGPNPADLVIATRFPSYVIEHPNKVVWLVHQLRQAYELDGTERGQFGDSFVDRSFRERIEAIDRHALGHAKRIFATSANVAGRLRDSTGFEAEVLPHPPQELDYRCDAYEPFVLSVGRLDSWKRIDLLLEAAALVPGLDVVVAGSGPERARLEQIGGGRFAGRVPPDELARLYATCRAVFYAPFDEDFGMVPLEAYRASKPVITTTDAGGPLDFVVRGETGWVAEPTPESLAAALRETLADEALARRYGEAGKPRADAITWDAALERLLA